jgi:hypothetical protein
LARSTSLGFPLASTIFIPQSGHDSWVPSLPSTRSGRCRFFFVAICESTSAEHLRAQSKPVLTTKWGHRRALPVRPPVLRSS